MKLRWLIAACWIVAGCLICQGGTAIARLGFYLDDWAILSAQRFSGLSSLSFLAAARRAPDLLVRPLDTPLWAAFYHLFGLHPLGWHAGVAVANVVLALLVLAVLDGLGSSWPLAGMLSLAFLACPSKDVTLYWPTIVTILAALILFAACHRLQMQYVTNGSRWFLAWSMLAFLACLGFYEQCVFMPFAFLGAYSASRPLEARRVIVSVSWLAVLIVCFLLYRLIVLPRLGVEAVRGPVFSVKHFAAVYVASIRVFVGPMQTLHVVRSIGAAATQHPGLSAIALALPWTAWRRADLGANSLAPSGIRVRVGALLFVLAYLPIAVSEYVPNTLNQENRVNLAASYGLAVLASGCWSRVGRYRWSGPALRILVGLLLCGQISTAALWQRSAEQQARIVDMIMRHSADWPKDSVLLLRLPKRYEARKVPIFDAHYDISGAINLRFGTNQRTADVVSPRIEFTPDGVHDFDRILPYSSVRYFNAETDEFRRIRYEDIRHLPPSSTIDD